MDPQCKASWIWACAAALLVAGCDIDSFDRVPEVAAQTRQDDTAIQPPANPPGNSSTRPAEDAGDAALSSRVEAALKAEPSLHGAGIHVRSEDGVVTLTGTTPDPQLRSMAAQVALSIDGVKLVRNEITLAQAT